MRIAGGFEPLTEGQKPGVKGETRRPAFAVCGEGQCLRHRRLCVGLLATARAIRGPRPVILDKAAKSPLRRKAFMHADYDGRVVDAQRRAGVSFSTRK